LPLTPCPWSTPTVFGYLILISMDFYNFICPFSPWRYFRLRRYIKHSKESLSKFIKNSKFVKVCQKYSAACRIFNSLLGVCKCGQTRSFVFDILHKVNRTVKSFKMWTIVRPYNYSVWRYLHHARFFQVQLSLFKHDVFYSL